MSTGLTQNSNTTTTTATTTTGTLKIRVVNPNLYKGWGRQRPHQSEMELTRFVSTLHHLLMLSLYFLGLYRNAELAFFFSQM